MELPPEERPVLERSHLKLTTVGNHHIPVWGKTTLDLSIGGQTVPCEVQIVQIPEEAVLGLDVIASRRCYWDWVQKTLVIPDSVQEDVERPRRSRNLSNEESDGEEACTDDADWTNIPMNREEGLDQPQPTSEEEPVPWAEPTDMECYLETRSKPEQYFPFLGDGYPDNEGDSGLSCVIQRNTKASGISNSDKGN